MSDLVGQQLGQYTITGQIGKGGMATVYRATQASIGREVAVKVLHKSLIEQDDSFLERFYREVQVKHSRNARFTLQNERGLFFVKVYQAALVTVAQDFEAGTELAVLGEMHSFVNRRCRNHHVFIKAQEIFSLKETSVSLLVKIEKDQGGHIRAQ